MLFLIDGNLFCILQRRKKSLHTFENNKTKLQSYRDPTYHNNLQERSSTGKERVYFNLIALSVFSKYCITKGMKAPTYHM